MLFSISLNLVQRQKCLYTDQTVLLLSFQSRIPTFDLEIQFSEYVLLLHLFNLHVKCFISHQNYFAFTTGTKFLCVKGLGIVIM